MHIRIAEREPGRSAWNVRFDDSISGDETRLAKLPPTSEESEIAIAVTRHESDPDADLELRIGKVIVASTRPTELSEFAFGRGYSESGSLRFQCVGHFFRDCVGVTELCVDVISSSVRRTALRVSDLQIAASKISQEVFETLCSDLANHSTSLLLDVYGKTYFGLEPEFRTGETAPLALMRRLRQAVDRLNLALGEIARRPALRLRGRHVRELALAGQSVNDLTLEEVCVDPTLAVRVGRGVTFREQIREDAVRHFDLHENRTLTSFLRFLKLQVADLRARAVRELEQRRANRRYRDRPSDDGPSWWQREDWPRIREIEQELETLAGLDAEIAALLRLPFLPSADRLREVPRITPLFRSHRAYADAFRTMVAHFQAFRVQIDGGHLLARARSLPVLYEWWCYLDLVRILNQCLRMETTRADDSPFRHVSAERDRMVIELAADQWLDFRDRTGRLVRLRYVPRYQNRYLDRSREYGLLGPEPELTPDLALEIYPTASDQGAPDLIVVLDAKYSTVAHAQLLDRMRSKYGRIGVFETGAVLSRQVWALAPTAPGGNRFLSPPWANSCTVDNLSFWSDRFDASSPVCGVIHVRPLLPTPSPLESLVRWTLEREGMVLSVSE